MNDQRVRVNASRNAVADIFNFDINKIYVPSEASVYYRMVDYFMTYSIAGEAITKKAEFIVSGMKIDSESSVGEEYGELLARKLDIKNKFVRLAIYYFAYGLAVLYPMPRVNKILECMSCHNTLSLEKLAIKYKPLYRYTDQGKYYTKCQNKNCKNHGVDKEFKLIEEEIVDIAAYNMAVWPPHQMSCVYNSVTDKKMWMYKCDNQMRDLLSQRDHYTIYSTPENFLTSIIKNDRVLVNSDNLYVLEYPTLGIKGIPIPPMVGAFQDLYQRQQYQKANRQIADDVMIPLRMLFPIWKGESGGTRPLLQTMNAEDWAKLTRAEINKWEEDKSHVPIMPVEIGTKNIWGEGKLLALNDHLRANMQDVLAAMGVPMEFIYGGATWSRQNVSAITLENVLKSFSIKLAEPLRFIEERTNKMLPKEQKIKIRLDMPRLVDSMMETSLLSQKEAEEKISRRTFLKSIGRNYDEEMRNLQREAEDKKRYKIDYATDQALAQLESEKVLFSLEKDKRKAARVEMLKDSLASRAIEKDQMMFNIYTQEYQYKKQQEMQKSQMRQQLKSQQAMAPVQLEIMREQLNMNQAAQLDMAKKMQKLQTMGIKKQIKAQYKAQQELQVSEQKRQMREQQQQAAAMMSDQEREALATLPPEQQQQMIAAFMEKARMMQVYEQLPDETKKEMEGMNEQEKIQAIQQFAQQMQEEEEVQNSLSQDESLKKEVTKQKLQDESEKGTVELLASEFNKLSPEDREIYKRELMQENTSLFAKVKSLADSTAKQEYLVALLNAKDEEKESVWQSASEKHPELLEDLMEEYNGQLIYKRQANMYAYKLYESRGTPEYDQVVAEIRDNTPQEFRKMILDEYKNIAGAGGVEDKADQYSDMQIQEIVQSLQAMDEESRTRSLEAIKYDDPELYGKINIMIEG